MSLALVAYLLLASTGLAAPAPSNPIVLSLEKRNPFGNVKPDPTIVHRDATKPDPAIIHRDSTKPEHAIIRRDSIKPQPAIVHRDDLISALTNVKTKYENRQNKKLLTSRIGDVVSSGSDVLYYVNVTVGTPPQTFRMSIDTTYNDIWLPSVQCTNCKDGNIYDFKSSNSSKNHDGASKAFYADNGIHSSIFSDSFTVAGQTISDQYFAVVDKVAPGFPQRTFTDGILPLTLGNSTFQNTPGFFQNLINSGHISEQVFGLYLARKGLDQDTSELILGGYDIQKADKSNYHKNTINGYWSVAFDSANIHKNAIVKPGYAVIDTATPLILAPPNDAKSFYDKVHKAKKASFNDAFYSFPCKNVPETSFTFDRIEYNMAADDFILGHDPSDASRCIGAIVGVDPRSILITKGWIIGDAFLKNVYTIFDIANNQVGFTSLTKDSSSTLNGSKAPFKASDVFVPNELTYSISQS